MGTLSKGPCALKWNNHTETENEPVALHFLNLFDHDTLQGC